jgi:hypothetical protein
MTATAVKQNENDMNPLNPLKSSYLYPISARILSSSSIVESANMLSFLEATLKSYYLSIG